MKEYTVLHLVGGRWRPEMRPHFALSRRQLMSQLRGSNKSDERSRWNGIIKVRLGHHADFE